MEHNRESRARCLHCGHETETDWLGHPVGDVPACRYVGDHQYRQLCTCGEPYPCKTSCTEASVQRDLQAETDVKRILAGLRPGRGTIDSYPHAIEMFCTLHLRGHYGGVVLKDGQRIYVAASKGRHQIRYEPAR